MWRPLGCCCHSGPGSGQALCVSGGGSERVRACTRGVCRWAGCRWERQKGGGLAWAAVGGAGFGMEHPFGEPPAPGPLCSEDPLRPCCTPGKGPLLRPTRTLSHSLTGAFLTSPRGHQNAQVKRRRSPLGCCAVRDRGGPVPPSAAAPPPPPLQYPAPQALQMGNGDSLGRGHHPGGCQVSPRVPAPG